MKPTLVLGGGNKNETEENIHEYTPGGNAQVVYLVAKFQAQFNLAALLKMLKDLCWDEVKFYRKTK